MDDALGGRRGRRAELTAAVLDALTAQYGVVSAGAIVDLGGSSNLNLLVPCANATLVVRVYRPSVSAARLADIQRARRHLEERGFPCPVPIPTADGSDWALLEGRLLEVEQYVESDGDMDTWDRVIQGLALLGRMHDVLSSVAISPDSRAPRFVNYLSSEDVTEATARGTERIRSWRPTTSEARLADRSEELAALITDAERDDARALLPRQLVHGDFWDDNVLYRRNKIVLVHDFDHMGERARVDDLALTLYYMSSEPAPPLTLAQRQSFIGRSVDANDSVTESPLSPGERAALPVALARQPLWSIGGWVADLDDDGAARAHAAGMGPAVEAALQIMRTLPQWQEALAEGSSGVAG